MTGWRQRRTNGAKRLGSSRHFGRYAYWPTWVMTWPWPDDLRSNFEIDLHWSKHTFSEPSRRVEHDGFVRLSVLSLFHFRISTIKKVINEKRSPWKTNFFSLMTSGVKTIELMSNLSEKRYLSIKRASQCFFGFLLAIISTFRDNIECFRKIAIFSKLDLWWTQYWPDLKMAFLIVWDLVPAYLMPFTSCRWEA